MGYERRKFTRRLYRRPVRVTEYIHGRESECEAVNLNPMGMYLNTRKRYRMGETVTVRFPSPSGDYEMVLNGEVVRIVGPVEARESGAEPGVAIRFFGMAHWDFNELFEFVYGSQEASIVVTSETIDAF
jgi:hypothetical protein